MEKIVLTIGTFDLLHVGHLELFRYGNQLGSLRVGINSDEFVLGYKGRRPVQDFIIRAYNVMSYGNTHFIYKNETAGFDLIDEVKPDVLLIGMDWHERDYFSQIGVTAQYFNDNNIVMVYAPRTTGVSTSTLRGANV